MFVTVPGVVALSTIVIVAVLPLARAPRLHEIVLLHEPWLGVAETNAAPAGTGSLTTTPVAGAGPLFLTVTVYVIGPPTTAFTEPVLLIFRSALSAPLCTVQLLLSFC